MRVGEVGLIVRLRLLEHDLLVSCAKWHLTAIVFRFTGETDCVKLGEDNF